jgi:hypothetical protein
MAVTIVATVGSASANSYVTQAEATAYLEGRLNSAAWTDASTGDKDIALVEAFRELNTRAYQGRRVSSTQAGQWPRQWVVDPDSPTLDYVSPTAIPQRVKDAQCELALEFLKAGTTDVAAGISDDGVQTKTVDVLSTTYFGPSERPRGLARYPRVLALLSPFFAGASGSAPILRG